MSWNHRSSYFSGQSGDRQHSSSTDGYGGGQHEATGGKKRPSSRLKKSGGKEAHADYPSYTTHGGDNGNYSNSYNSQGNGGYGSTSYGNGYDSTVPYYGGGGGYNKNSSFYSNGGGGYNKNNSSYSNGGGGYNKNNSSYSNGGGGYTGGAVIPYDAPAAFWAPHDGTRSPMFINTKEVNVYAMPGSQYDNGYNKDQRRRGGSGFFRPAFEAVGRFFDRKFGFNDRD